MIIDDFESLSMVYKTCKNVDEFECICEVCKKPYKVKRSTVSRLKKLNNNEKIKEIIFDVLRNKMFYMMFILTMFVFLGWRIYCNSIVAIDDYRILENTDTSTITSVSHLLKSIIGSLTGYGYDNQAYGYGNQAFGGYGY